jgi:HEAT repeat protein/TolA-binding protein
MKCPRSMTLGIALALASAAAPARAQLTPRAPRTPPRVETPPLPDATPRALVDIDASSNLERLNALADRDRAIMARTIERQRVLQERQRELQEQQLESQDELEQRQRGLIDAELERRRAWAPDDADDAFLRQRAPAAWDRGDPADSLYRVAREALNRGDYRRAAQLFNDLARRYPSSSYAYVSGYYEAFSRYRIGTTEELEAAERALEALSGRSAPSSRGWRDETDVNGLRTRIRGALAMRGDASAAEKVEETARQAGSSCDQEDLMVRVEALNALSQMDAAAALPILRRVMERRDECLVELRRRAVFMLARRGDAEATSELITAARNDPNLNVRSEAIGFLGRMPGDAPVSALEDLLRTSDDERIQRSAVRALISSDSPRARSSVRALLDRRDAPETVRIQVLDAYTRDHGTPDDADYLRALYTHAESERFKMALIGAIARIGGKENQDWLVGLVRNANESVQLRSTALQRLSRTDVPIADFARMYDVADSRSLRVQLLSSLATRKEPEATDKLMDVARNSTDPEMRRQAIYYLSRRNDPRATKLLMELIEK